MQRVTKLVEELRAQNARQDARLEELANRLLVLSNRVSQKQSRAEPAQASQSAKSAHPELEVVRLVPEEQAAPMEKEAPPIELKLRGEPWPQSLNVVALPPPPTPREDPERLFNEALAAYRQGELQTALRRFSSFLGHYPRHGHADNALYWMGECRYDAAEYQQAIAQFAEVRRRFPKSAKVPEALHKMALAYDRLGETENARKTLTELVHDYPQSAVAELARSRLAAPAKAGGS